MAIKRTLVVGGGSIGERHIRCFQEINRSEVSLCELDPIRGGELAQRYQIPYESDYERALTGNPDTVVICTPAPLHLPMALKAVRQGCHVLIEKPLSISEAGIAELAQEAASRQLVVGVAYVWLMHPVLRQAKQLLEAGRIGAPLQLLAQCGQDFASLRAGYEKTYYARHEMGGGAIQDGLTHVANVVEWLVGPTDSVLCEADHLSIPKVEVEDVVGVVARNSGAMVVYSFNQVQKPSEFCIDVHGTEGSLRLDLAGKRLGIFHQDQWEYEEMPYADHDVLFRAQAAAFLDAAERGQPHTCSLQAGEQTLKFNLACLESAKTGRRVEL